jgi:hypothetical protein
MIFRSINFSGDKRLWGRPLKGFGDALYIYRFEIMILLRVKEKSLLCY